MSSAMLDLPTGATLACIDTGSGRPILLLHGVCMSKVFSSATSNRSRPATG